MKLACGAALSAAALLAAACGSSSSPPAASPAGVAVTPAQVPNTNVHAPVRVSVHTSARAAARAAAVRKVVSQKANEHYAPALITKGNAARRAVTGTGGAATNDDNPAAKAPRADSGGRPSTNGQPNPCLLVSVAQADAFTGQSVSVKEAPLGPTCIYQHSGAGAPLTMSVQRLALPALTRHIKLSRLTIGGHVAYCGKYGNPITFVPLSGGRVLSISAPCTVGAKFAAAALPKLG